MVGLERGAEFWLDAKIKNNVRLSFRRFVLFACSLPDLARRIGIQNGDTQPDG